ncbi:MAG TPA: hypothetical protein VM910_28700, partial [Bradyrhizobium sp.]|nr:hypothetical protein [Bradyrhizobium sp.]
MIRDTLIRDDANKQISFDDRSMQFGRSVATSRHDFTTAFELAPDAQRLFPSDMERQHLKLMDMIAAIVGALDERELFQSIIGDTG